ncbi:bifunctional phosphoribosyl-AMP cyclohydrolase/phosphoribosyl-ATP diphosphatase HisIE [Sphingosinicella sp. YJ22]|uniref:bifunctional phosphoribosyl-AMP cyclohydrolase/phosphoribosyl-ATP diphosphatase HisIE n=1 Tax=Sphingosinicella sp. YJ22 TaxID=1104780 RepID=UPI001407956C|nr:bifunctional phosphoribosyl-AMP cyclohydrolase/phosphoribosyl-ATP diphosphatase HisIE [Sphingosinicella sp. YJ22]
MRDRDAPLTAQDIDTLAWDKMDNLIPATIQDRVSGRVLMLGYMNREALTATLATGLGTFWSRSKQRLWIKGETSGNVLRVAAVHADCDGDAILVLADPAGPTCHLGTMACFGDAASSGPGWLAELSRIVADRASTGSGDSYTRRLLAQGPPRIAQKIGEEGVEVALAGAGSTTEHCAEEVADLLYHVAVLMEARGFGWSEVIAVLRSRHAVAGEKVD